MASIFQTTVRNAFSWMQIYEFRLKWQWSLFLRVQPIIFKHCFGKNLSDGLVTSKCLSQSRLIYWRIYAPLGLNELVYMPVWDSITHDMFLWVALNQPWDIQMHTEDIHNEKTQNTIANCKNPSMIQIYAIVATSYLIYLSQMIPVHPSIHLYTHLFIRSLPIIRTDNS